ncbi:chaplin [Streptomyces sp. NPDC000410]|uniref:chaplin n=1 Tax=Streptomyces sp. NPDC000410 TaxID=3154254 RepID=UPI003317CCF0
MRQIRRTGRTGLVAVIVTGGALAAAGTAQADSGAHGGAAHSPGLVSGNTVQLPVHVPVNVCGNTVNVVGLLNPAVGNSCTNDTADTRGTTGGALAEGGSRKDSPGVLSGNGIQLPIEVPVNVTGNSVNVVGVGNASTGNSSSNGPGKPAAPKPVPPPKTRPGEQVRHAGEQKPVHLAETGGPGLGLTVPAGAALLLGGAVLYRRSRSAARVG